MKWSIQVIVFLSLFANPVFAKKKSVSVLEAKKEEIQKELLFPARIVPGKMAHVLAEFPSIVEKIEINLGDKVDTKNIVLVLKHSDPIFNERKIVVRAPISGRIAKIHVSEGSQIVRGEKLVTIASSKGEKIQIEVPAKDLHNVKKEQSGVLKIDGLEFKVKVAGVSPLVDAATGTASADVVFDEQEEKRPLGVLGKIQLISDKREGFLLPEHAITYQGKETFVKIVTDSKVTKTKVQLGERLRDRVEVVEGLTAGSLVVERASGYLADGAEVEVQNPPQAKKEQ